ncbi:hypothetical protein PybrP1_003436 [[Pythium] brassicae (nom. inval.)]|nr:hypothetical protein PybrP1_003436 [[Pythium] brassicae (nom. inval.)]
MASLQLTDVPLDAWPAVARCLSGADLFALAQASRWSWRLFSQDDFWRERLSSADAAATVENTTDAPCDYQALRSYLRAFSFRLRGQPKVATHSSSTPRGSAVDLPQFFNEVTHQRAPLSFALTFCLLPESDGVFAGGVLFGAQSAEFAVSYWPHYHQQFAVVSSDRALFCSLLDDKPEVATELATNRWYHLALSYNQRTQRVYLDGELVSTLEGGWHRELWNLQHAQVGSGCITAGEGNFPLPNVCGWYPFNGVLDDFCMWKHALSGDDVRALAAGRALAAADVPPPFYALKRDLLYFPMQHAVTGASGSRAVAPALEGVAWDNPMMRSREIPAFLTQTKKRRRRPEVVRERDRQFAKRVYHQTLTTLEELQGEVASLEAEVAELLASHHPEHTVAASMASETDVGSVERQQPRDRYVMLIRDRLALEATNAALEGEAARLEKLARHVMQLAGAELRANERAQHERDERGARPPGKDEYRAITSEYCAQVTDRAYKRVVAYRERSPSSFTWGAELFGWKDFRTVEQSCITYSLEKIFLFQRAESMTQRYWELATAERSSKQLYSPSLNVRFHILQHVDADNIVIYRTIDRAAEAGENGLEQRMRTFVLTSRVQLGEGKGWGVFTCAIDPKRVLASLTAPPKGRTRLEPVREEMWMDNLKWLICEPMGENGEHAKLVFGGVLDSVATANPSQWILEELMIGIRYERGGHGPFSILPDD